MNRKLLLNALLALVVIGLGLWILYGPKEDKNEAEKTAVAVSTLDPKTVNKIRIVRTGLPEFVLEKQGEIWVQTAPFKARTDNTQARRLLDLLNAKARSTLPAESLERFELSIPSARVWVGEQEFAFGMVNDLTTEQYLLTQGKVYLVAPTYGYGLPTREDALASRMLFAEDEGVQGVETSSVKIVMQDGKWVETPPREGEALSQDDYARWIDDWRFASSTMSRPATNDGKGEKVKITLRGGKTLEFIIAKRAPELILVRPDEKMEFIFAPEMARMLNPPPPAEKLNTPAASEKVNPTAPAEHKNSTAPAEKK